MLINNLEVSKISYKNTGLSDESFRELVCYALSHKNSIEHILIPYKPSICACLGCRENFSSCPCSMNSMVSKYRFEILSFLKEKNVNFGRWERFRKNKKHQQDLANKEFTRKLQEMLKDG